MNQISQDGGARICSALKTDERCRALEYGLNQLSLSELQRLQASLRVPGRIALDEYNYDPSRNLWCPLAVGLGVPAIAAQECAHGQMSNRFAKDMIRRIGRAYHGSFTLNPIKGIPGAFFRENRHVDLKNLVDFVIDARYASDSLR
jgi:hypothetical protein